jgi:hypothetical protein
VAAVSSGEVKVLFVSVSTESAETKLVFDAGKEIEKLFAVFGAVSDIEPPDAVLSFIELIFYSLLISI